MLMRINIFVFILILQSSCLFSAEVTRAFPQGFINEASKIEIEFDSDVSAAGPVDVKQTPIEWSCEQDGVSHELNVTSSKWLTPRKFQMSFMAPYQNGLVCDISTKDQLKNFNNEQIVKKNFSFTNSLFRISQVTPESYDYTQISSDQYFFVEFSLKPDEKSFYEHSYIEIENLKDKVKLVPVDLNSEYLKTNFTHYLRDAFYKYDLTEKWKNFKEKNVQEFISKYMKNAVLFHADRKLPDQSKVNLIISKNTKNMFGSTLTEERIIKYKTAQLFKATFNCQRENEKAACHPLGEMRLTFTKPILEKYKKEIYLLKGKEKIYPSNVVISNDFSDDSSSDKYIEAVVFSFGFSAETKYSLVIPSSLKDQNGAGLINQKSFPLAVAVGEHSPVLKFSSSFGLLEWDGKVAYLPMHIRNIETKLPFDQVDFNGKDLLLNDMKDTKKLLSYLNKSLQDESFRDSQGKTEEIHSDKVKVVDSRSIPTIVSPDAKKMTIARNFAEKDTELMGIPLSEKGFHIVEFKSPKLGRSLLEDKKPMYVLSSALVTNLSVHIKTSPLNTLVWVTRLDSAQPVEGAEIVLTDCSGQHLVKGKSDKSGLLMIKTPAVVNNNSSCHFSMGKFVAFAKVNDDFSFTASGWKKGIESFRYALDFYGDDSDFSYDDSPLKKLQHTVLSQKSIRPNETLHFKTYFRKNALVGLQALAANERPVEFEITNNEVTYKIPVIQNANDQSINGSFKIPKDAALGVYYIIGRMPKNSKTGHASTIHLGHFFIDEFVLQQVELSIVSTKPDLKNKTVKFDIFGRYLSGGPTTSMPVKVTRKISRLDSSFSYFDRYKEYNYLNTKLEPYVSDTRRFENDTPFEPIVEVKELKLSKDGGYVAEFKPHYFPGKYTMEQLIVEYKDPNGEIRTVSSTIEYSAVNEIIGLKPHLKSSESSSLKFYGVTFDSESKRLPFKKYKVELFQSINLSHRKRLVGGFYSYDNKYEIKSLGIICEGESDKNGEFECEKKVQKSGSYFAMATINEDNNPAYAVNSSSIYGYSETDGDIYESTSDSDRIDVILDKKDYKVGDLIKANVKTPFKNAKALVSIEREGIIESFVLDISRDKPMIVFPCKKEYGPNAFISVLLIRGRVGDLKHDFFVDLGKPAMKLAVGEFSVDKTQHELKISVSTPKKKYAPREEVEVEVKTSSFDGKNVNAGTVAVIVYDDSLDLYNPNDTFSVLNSMILKRPLKVETATSMTQVIGKRHFGLKAKSIGGDGASGNAGLTREIFNPLVAFLPNVQIGQDGKAKVKFKLNDSLTSFKIQVVASSGLSQFGSAYTTINTTKDVIAYAGIPPEMRVGDEPVFDLSVRNTTKENFKGKMIFSQWIQGKKVTMLEEAVNAAASESSRFKVKFTSQTGSFDAKYEMTVLNEAGAIVDSLSQTVKLSPAEIPTVISNQLMSVGLESPQVQSVVQLDKSSKINQSSVEVALQSSLIGSNSAANYYMVNYPFECLEQKISKSVVADNGKAFQAIIKELPKFIDKDGLLKFYPSDRCGYVDLNNFVLEISRVAQFELGASLKETLVGGLKKAMSGELTCLKEINNPYLTQLNYDMPVKLKTLSLLSMEKKVANLETAKFQQYFSTMPIKLEQLSLESTIDYLILLNNVKDLKVPLNTVDKLKQNINQYFTEHGGIMTYKDAFSNFNFFYSGNRAISKYLIYAVTFLNDPVIAGKLVKLASSNVDNRGWGGTIQNAYLTAALKLYSSVFERAKVTGETNLTFGKGKKNYRWSNEAKSKIALSFEEAQVEYGPEKVSLQHQGEGRVWASLMLKTVLHNKSIENQGFKLEKSIIPVEVASKKHFTVGDVIKIVIKVKTQNPSRMVALIDPIPSGASHIKNNIASDDNGQYDVYYDTSYDTNEEKRFLSYVLNQSYVAAGEREFSYLIRLNSAGKFKLPKTRIEMMYSPDVFGELANDVFEIRPQAND